MRFTAHDIDRLKLELEREFDALGAPTGPTTVWGVASTDLPPAGRHPSAVVHVTDLNILAVSDGTDWIRQDTGAAIA